MRYSFSVVAVYTNFSVSIFLREEKSWGWPTNVSWVIFWLVQYWLLRYHSGVVGRTYRSTFGCKVIYELWKRGGKVSSPHLNSQKTTFYRFVSKSKRIWGNLQLKKFHTAYRVIKMIFKLSGSLWKISRYSKQKKKQGFNGFDYHI